MLTSSPSASTLKVKECRRLKLDATSGPRITVQVPTAPVSPSPVE